MLLALGAKLFTAGWMPWHCLDYPLVNIQKAIENGHLSWIYPLKIVIFHSYVSLPEGTRYYQGGYQGLPGEIAGGW